jgi:hypothetical protein
MLPPPNPLASITLLWQCLQQSSSATFSLSDCPSPSMLAEGFKLLARLEQQLETLMQAEEHTREVPCGSPAKLCLLASSSCLALLC